jgi:hypothetical protein
MTVYRVVWTTAVGLLVARGLVVGIEHRPGVTSALFMLGAAVGAAWSARRGGRHPGVVAVVAGAAAAATASHAETLGAGLLLILAMILATAPRLLTAYDRGEPTPWGQETAWDALVRGFATATPGYAPPTRVSQLSDAQLWAEWQDTGTALRRPAPEDRILDLVELRESYLDELERRNPRQVAGMLSAGPDIDWDALTRRPES